MKCVGARRLRAGRRSSPTSSVRSTRWSRRWLPGTEGAGVADVLFGKRPFTGRLPVTWPATRRPVPINVGDATYDPLYPYGWGLTTHAR